ncbi:hypothetical protein IW262DRAFT_1416134, partial [Armillaria fumosa]
MHAVVTLFPAVIIPFLSDIALFLAGCTLVKLKLSIGFLGVDGIQVAGMGGYVRRGGSHDKTKGHSINKHLTS